MIIQNDTAECQSEIESIVPETSSNNRKALIFRLACIILFAAGVLFFIFFAIGSQHIPMLNYTNFITLSVIAAMVTIFLCFCTSGIKVAAFKVVALIIAGIVLAANWYIYFRYLPKYSPREACEFVKADPEYASASIEPHNLYFYSKNDNETQLYNQLLYCKIEGNPFCDMGYILDVISEGKVVASITFDSSTGKYEFREPVNGFK